MPTTFVLPASYTALRTSRASDASSRNSVDDADLETPPRRALPLVATLALTFCTAYLLFVPTNRPSLLPPAAAHRSVPPSPPSQAAPGTASLPALERESERGSGREACPVAAWDELSQRAFQHRYRAYADTPAVAWSVPRPPRCSTGGRASRVLLVLVDAISRHLFHERYTSTIAAHSNES